MSASAFIENVPLTRDKNGVIRVGNTRVTLDSVVASYSKGYSPKEIVMQFDSLKMADVYSVIGYYLHHQSELDDYIHQQDEKAAQLKQQIQARQGPNAVRERLLAGRKKD